MNKKFCMCCKSMRPIPGGNQIVNPDIDGKHKGMFVCFPCIVKAVINVPNMKCYQVMKKC